MTIDIDKLEALAKAATPGPWHSPGLGEVHDDPNDRVIFDVCWPEFDVPLSESFSGGRQEDADYVAAANPAAVLALIAEVRALRERRNGPGSPTARLHHLMDELDERFPDAIDKYSSAPQDHKYLEAIDAAIARGAK